MSFCTTKDVRLMISFRSSSVSTALYGCWAFSQYSFQNKENKELNTFLFPMGIAQGRICTADRLSVGD